MGCKSDLPGKMKEDGSDGTSVAAAAYEEVTEEEEEEEEEEEPFEVEFYDDDDDDHNDDELETQPVDPCDDYPLPEEEEEASGEEPCDDAAPSDGEVASGKEPFYPEPCDEEEDSGEEDSFHAEPLTHLVRGARSTCSKQLYEVEPCDDQVACKEEFVTRRFSAVQAVRKDRDKQEALNRALKRGGSKEQKVIPVTDEMELKPFKKRLSVRFATDVSCYTYNTESFGAAKLEKRKAQFDEQDNHLCKRQEHMLSLPQDGGKLNEVDDTNLYVDNLPASMSSSRLVDLFAPFGQIVRSNVVDDCFTGVGCGFVMYGDSQSAASAIKCMNGRLVCGKKLEVRVAGVLPSVPNPSMHSVSETGSLPSAEIDASKGQEDMLSLPQDGGKLKQVDDTNLYVGNLPASVSSHKLLELFLPFGRVVRYKVVDDCFTGISQGHGFVKYADPDSAASAIKHMNGRLVDGQKLEVRAAGVPPSVPNPSMHSVSEACSLSSKEIDTSGLYVCNLPISMDEPKLLELFLPFGKVTAIKVPRDYTTGLSKGYGFVKYSDSHHAAEAITHLNGFLVEGRKLLVRVAGSPSTLSNSAVGSQTNTRTIKEIDMANLYVCNIHASIDTNKLVELFLPFGKITHARVAVNQGTCSGNGYGFVRFADPQCAAEAIALMNGSLIEGETLTVRVAGLSSSPSSSAVQGSALEINKSRLYVTNLPRSMNADKLVSLFVPFGQISKVVINVEYSLVYYADVASAITAAKNMDGYLIEGKRLAVRRSDFCPTPTNAAEHALSESADKPRKEIDMANLFVGSIPPMVTADQLVELFQPFGQVVQARLFQHKGYGMVRYDNSSSAAAAIDRMDGYQIGGSTLVVRVAGLPNPGDSGYATNALTPHMPGNEQRQIDMTNLYVCNLPFYITTEKLVEIFLPCGQITQAKVCVDRYTGLGKGFGFVRFADTYGATVALTHMNGYLLEGHILEVRIAGVHPSAMSGYMTYLYSQLTYPDPSTMAVGVPTSYWPYYCAESAYAWPAENQGPATDASSQTSQQEGFPESMSLSPVTEKGCSSSVSSHATDPSQPESSAGWTGPPGFQLQAVSFLPPSAGWAGPPGFEPHAVPKKDLGTVMDPSQPCSKVYLAQSEGGQKRHSIV